MLSSFLKEARASFLPRQGVEKNSQHLTPISPWNQQPPFCMLCLGKASVLPLNQHADKLLCCHGSHHPRISLKKPYVFFPTSEKKLEIKTNFLEGLLCGLGEGPSNYFLCLLEELPPCFWQFSLFWERTMEFYKKITVNF